MSDKRTSWAFYGYKALILNCNKGLSSTGSDAKPLYGATFSLDMFMFVSKQKITMIQLWPVEKACVWQDQ